MSENHVVNQQKVASLISTSVSDAKITLECMLNSSPMNALKVTIDCIEKMQKIEGNLSRKKMLSAVARKAIKKLEESY